MDKKKYFKWTTLMVAPFAAAWIIMFAIFIITDGISVSSEPSKTDTEQTVSHYKAIIKNDKIYILNIYDDGTEEIVIPLDTDISMLRAADKRALEKGIVLTSKEDIASFIEDFTS